jgi:hypothetical protein
VRETATQPYRRLHRRRAELHERHLLNPKQFATSVKSETATYAEIIKRANIPLED